MKRKHEDICTLVLEEEEKAFLKARIKILDYIPPYFKDLPHIMTHITNLMTLIVILMHIADVVAHTSKLAAWVAR